ncbi:hypothetical protein AZE42_02417 [Rhizopogon vesiculosus]|uniref:Heme-copper oxidase subunit III family profile domain-containing protein n=1 Tax=Rhizopogon vesiculosus TaxID=180088 RepID=A0A1J8R7S3_9AGAM|nr:hypothetical protein AZE42_02417 [Rhizopogon vesiculosus]
MSDSVYGSAFYASTGLHGAGAVIHSFADEQDWVLYHY